VFHTDPAAQTAHLVFANTEKPKELFFVNARKRKYGKNIVIN
jgi:hypothetical protein